MLQSGRVAFGAMETVVFGKPAAETVAEKARRREAERVFLMVSGTLNRTTEEIAKVRRALGNRLAALFDHMPPHTPRHAVIEAAEMARGAGADLIVTVGRGSTTDGAKAVQLCLANDVRTAEAIQTAIRSVGAVPLQRPTSGVLRTLVVSRGTESSKPASSVLRLCWRRSARAPFRSRGGPQIVLTRIQPLVHCADRGSRKAVAAQLLGDRPHFPMLDPIG
jgi:alcohol dehydrogenase YqhD (iron-dependent ADH family)